MKGASITPTPGFLLYPQTVGATPAGFNRVAPTGVAREWPQKPTRTPM